jgi:dynein heavy chain 1
MREELE